MADVTEASRSIEAWLRSRGPRHEQAMPADPGAASGTPVDAGAEGETLPTLQQAHRALEGGDAERARQLAAALLGCAQDEGDMLLESQVLIFLANCDRLGSRYRRAYDTSQRAAHLAQRVQDLHGEVVALSTLAHVASSLGRSQEAIEAALLSTRLIEALPPSEPGVVCLNYLGVAYLWSRYYEKADLQFDEAARLAAACVPPVSTMLPRANQLCVQLLKTLHHRYTEGTPPALEIFEQRMAQFERDFQFDVGRSIVPGYHATLFIMLGLIWAALQCFAGRLERATAGLAQCRNHLSALPSLTWAHAMACWLDAEIAAAQCDWPRAEAHAAEMLGIAIRVEHEQLACMGHLCASDILARQGKHESARQELQRLRRREQMIRAEALEGRVRVVALQLESRQNARSLHAAQSTSRRFESLALQDALTGIANRRRFELRMEELLSQSAGAAEPVCVALLDVDRFKAVNDGHGHAVGDAVLKTIAQTLAAHMRDTDLPARLAGDEFVIVFGRTGIDTAKAICERIRTAVAGFDWGSVAAGLAVSVSLGVAASRAGDSPRSLLERSDMAMYEAKRGSSRLPTCSPGQACASV